MVKVKSLVIVLMVMSCIGIFFSQNAAAIESVTLGLKYWYPQWELDGYGGFDTIDWTTDYGMIGPTASVILSQKWALSFSMIGGSFTKDLDSSSTTYIGYPTEAKWSSTRSDLDAIVAYLISPYFNVFGGLKFLVYNQKIDGQWAPWTGYGSWNLKYDMSAGGVGLGIGSNIPLGDTPFALYGTLSGSYLMGTFDVSGSHFTGNKGDVTYPIVSAEVGTRYSMSSIPLVFMGSLRYQMSTIDISWDTEGMGFDSLDEKFYGAILFAGYRFSF